MVAKISTAMLFVILALYPIWQITTTRADALKASGIHVIDSDTNDAVGKRIRLVGFDTPELRDHAHCGLERMLAARATSRLRRMIQLSNDTDLQLSLALVGRALPERWPATMGALAAIRRSTARTLAMCSSWRTSRTL